MTIPPDQQETARFLTGLAGRAPKETHISAVFIGADTVWKLKKAVRLSFLDFSTIDQRRKFVHRELELNRVFAPDLYRDVVPVVRRAGALALGGEGEAVDWVLRMARVPEHDFLEAIVAGHAITPALLDAIADAVASAHRRLAPVTGIDWPAAIRSIADGNRAAALEAGLPPDRVQDWHRAVGMALDRNRDWLTERAARGFVRRAHGDLHLGNLCLWHGKPVAFDALEFDEALATIDLAYDLAFLLMDLDRRLDRAAANRVMNRVIARSGDVGMLTGLPVYLSIRAIIRALVQAARREADALPYLDAAEAYLQPAPALVVAVGGLQGTGKTTLARALAPGLGLAPGALLLRSDEVRKRLHGVAPEQKLPADAYSPEANAQVDKALIDLAEMAAKAGHAVIVDSTFIDRDLRRRLADRAQRCGRPFLGLWLQAPLSVLEQRVGARSGDASDATVDVLRQFAARDPGPGDWVAIEAVERQAALARAQQAVRTVLPVC